MAPSLRVAVLAAMLVASVGCKRSSTTDPVVEVKDTDAEMNAAIAEARRRWPEFVTAFHARKPGERFSAKYPFPTRAGRIEHIWLKVSAITSDQVTGVLDNEPDGDVGHKLGETVSVPSSGISDWLYTGGGTEDMVGGFTIKVMLTRQKGR